MRDQCLLALALALSLMAVTVSAQQAPSVPGPYEPTSGQPGKDVVWVPTPDSLVQTMLDLARVQSGEYLIDLGSGDGRTVIAAARRGLRAHGIEYNPDLVTFAQGAARREGVADRATFEQADLFERLDALREADVITLFLLTSLNLKLRPELLELRPGTRIVSNTFRMADWEPDEEAHIDEECTSWCNALLWIVPAKIEGRWQMGAQPLSFSQEFQRVSGILGARVLDDLVLRGAEISFTVNGVRYRGSVDGDRMTGTDSSGASWTARRATP